VWIKATILNEKIAMQSRLFYRKQTNSAALPTPDQLLDSLYDDCASMADRNKLLQRIAAQQDGMQLIVEAQYQLASSYLVAKRIGDQLDKHTSFKEQNRQAMLLSVEIVQEMLAFTSRYMAVEGQHMRTEVLADNKNILQISSKL
jgi:hypothetical protein